MGYALKLYEAFREYGEEKAKLLAEAFEEVEKRYPQLKEMVSRTDLSETELRLIKEIEQTRKEIKEVELKLSKEIEQTRKEMKEIELKLSKEIEQTRKEIKEIELKLSKEIKELELKFTKEMRVLEFKLLRWMFIFWCGQIAAVFSLLKWFLK
jgi:predicted RNase H-like nuclease (RuvC/YqgF family)